MGPPPDALLDQISNPQYKNHHSVVHSGNDNNQPDEEVDIIDSFFADPDVYSPGESTRQGNSADVDISDYLESANQVIRHFCTRRIVP